MIDLGAEAIGLIDVAFELISAVVGEAEGFGKHDLAPLRHAIDGAHQFVGLVAIGLVVVHLCVVAGRDGRVGIGHAQFEIQRNDPRIGGIERVHDLRKIGSVRGRAMMQRTRPERVVANEDELDVARDGGVVHVLRQLFEQPVAGRVEIEKRLDRGR